MRPMVSTWVRAVDSVVLATDLTSALVFSRGSRDFVALLSTYLPLSRRSTQLQSALERSSIEWTDGIDGPHLGEGRRFRRPSHGCDERSGFSRGSRDCRRAPRDLLASAETIDESAERYRFASRYSCAASQRSASSAAMQPVPAAVTAWR